ncbi:peptide chain release factor 3 [Staphylococcus condimenti]|uniref:Peptide chain release factor 3 n=1 Tax=Staphylococcus condimenti TaxID=70255 RepID=A0A143P9W3_9STAP|nr:MULTISPECIES: peptide chain release factor 3 [Staphylococcus]AMY05295.1 peptide chain release factor 3 [Staphylococcus condimenti]APR61502.1 peptide chain release factor 3 [Staphylococcus condimenti]MDK8645304.1 peptide chain release factor 3 [Staphylococcus condimenti]OFO98757.1 peptide chain release factor 3 [Staphylococcus sp. HMSC065E08]PNZ58363.1 peptide chain release factor 3 [Staphylococcus condimenti]
MSIKDEIESRKTFAIISHPDAGKTTLTEKLLLFGGAIREAGTVKGKKSGKFATSDWMKVEQERGISVTSSVMQFDYDDYNINILDTPGHEDFSEDTYRTLMAVDSAVMVIDCAKGIEPQTLKLFKVCKMRGIPIFTFINKLDRVGKEPFELLDEIEETLNIKTYPMNWPVGMGQNFFGIIDREQRTIEPFRDEEHLLHLNDDYELEEAHEITKDSTYTQAIDEFMLVEEAGEEFDNEMLLAGELTPVFFGSALANFGVQSFLNAYVDHAPMPNGRITKEAEEVSPFTPDFSGFIFKIQANMDPKHRDRIAFMRIVSGAFERGMDVKLQRTNKKQKITRSTSFMADDKETVNHAVAGDIIGLYDTGNYQIGDTLVGGNQKFSFEDLPQFTPELFMKVSAKNVMKQKHFHKGIEQLVQEGAIQYYKTLHTNQIILGAVGQLQFEVFEHRMKNEYNVDVVMEPVGRKIARWVENEDDIKDKMSTSRSILVQDRYEQKVFLFENEFATRWFEEKFPEIKLYSLL